MLARIYQPIGNGPFPVLLDLHGGAWTCKDRMASVDMAEAMARSGILTVSEDLLLGGEALCPTSLQDVNYAIRWLQMKAPQWNGDPFTIGAIAQCSAHNAPGAGHLIPVAVTQPGFLALTANSDESGL